MKTYNLFISHSWRYGDHYDNLINLLKKRTYFSYKDHSVPKDDPVHDADNAAELEKAIKNHMHSCHVVLVMAGVYSTYSKWINIEIDLAKKGFSSAKPLIAIKPWGNTNVSSVVREAAVEIVNWNTESIVDAIRRHG